MRHIIYILSFALSFTMLACQNTHTGNNQSLANNISKASKPSLKRYNVKSGMVKYVTKIHGKMMGSNISGSGTEELYFKDWGNLELKKKDEKKITHINIFGQKKTEVEETHTINKLDNGKSYMVDSKNKLIYLRRDPAMEMMKTFNNGNVVDPGKKMLESMGGKKVGKEKILGYTCDVWEIPGGKQWIYKGLPLKIVMTIMGVTSSTTAVSAKFNTNVADSHFKLPDYPIQKEEGYLNDKAYAKDQAEMRKGAEKMKNMSYEQYKQMLKKDDPEEYKNMSEKDIKMGYQLMKKMAQQMSH